MTGFNHGLTGAVIALSIKQPLLAVPLSFASHYVTDMVPHLGFKQDQVLEPKFNRFTKADFVFSLLLMLILGALFPAHIVLIWVCMAAAAISDIVWWFYRKSVKDWPHGLDRLTARHFRLNNRVHTTHFYFDILWFLAMWTILIFIKLR